MSWNHEEETALATALAFNKAQSLDEVCNLLSDFLQNYGFDYWAMMQFANPNRIPLDKRIAVTNWPKDYRIYRAMHPNELHDPVIREAQRTSKPFLWEQAYRRAGTKGKGIMDMAAEFGLVDGIVFPVRSIDQLPGGVSIGGETKHLSKTHIQLLNLVCIHAYDRAESLVGGEPFALECALSPRQIEVLSAASVGLTSMEIAHKLCLSPRTVEHYCGSAREVLKAKNITHAVSTAIEAGFILP